MKVSLGLVMSLFIVVNLSLSKNRTTPVKLTVAQLDCRNCPVNQACLTQFTMRAIFDKKFDSGHKLKQKFLNKIFITFLDLLFSATSSN